MHPAIRTQTDQRGEEYSLRGRLDATDRPGNRDMARQEGKADADINVLMARFGVVPPQKQVYFGDVDYGVDLQQALSAVKQAREAWQQMPPEIKQDFPTWQSLLNGLELGVLELKPESERPAPKTVPTETTTVPVAPA